MKVYTKMGDRGKTQFFGCGLVQKDDARIEALGAIDELNCTLGVALCFIEDERLRANLTEIQNDLFQVGADIAGSSLSKDSTPRIIAEHTTKLEGSIDVIHDRIGIPNNFVLPRGTVSSSFLHLCRSITRRAERTLVKLQNEVELNSELLKYVNRLSDLFWMLARQANNEVNVKEQQPIYKYFSKEEFK